jgi:hypothetical protein
MSKRYTGGVVSSAVPTVNAAGASGVFTLGQQASAQSNNNWPPFKVEKSLRFRKSVNAYLSRTLNSTSTTYTVSAWVKRGLLSGYQYIFASGPNSASDDKGVAFDTSTNQIYAFNSSTQGLSTAVFRDPAAWYHVVMSVNSGTATVYVNNVNTGISHTSMALGTNGRIGRFNDSSSANDFDGYMSEVYLIDGQALTPSSFGATDKDGNWSPIAYTGTYGQNGFYLNFKDATSTTTLGYDYSGNGNNWTPNNLSVTAGATNDSLQDVPEDQSDGTAYGGRGNYCTMNPLFVALDANFFALSNANLTIAGTSASNSGGSVGNMSSKTGKFYYEFNITSLSAGYCAIGASDVDQLHTLTPFNYLGYGSKSYGYFSSGSKTNNNGTTAYGSSYTTGDVIGVAVDCDNGAIYFSKNNTWQTSGDPTSGATKTGAAYTWTGASQNMIPQMDVYQTGAVMAVNFGQRPFSYTPPVGFKTLNTYNLPEPTIKQPNKHFDASLYTGTRATQTITNAGFQPDLIWFKPRSLAYSHHVFDTIRGTTRDLNTNGTSAEYGWTGNLNLTPNSSGFSIGADSTEQVLNEVGATYVAWQWNAGGANTTNTSGSVTSIVRANPTAGFSVVTYTANASDPITVGHGLGVAPSMFMVKSRSASGTDWFVYHSSLGATKNLRLNSYVAAATATNVWNNTAPTSNVITTSNAINTNGVTYVAYCFAQIDGYSSFGSYTGNGSTNGPFVYTGFRPKFIMIKNSTFGGTTTSNWFIRDTSRDTYNVANKHLWADLSVTESNASYAASQYENLDILSNGFKLRNDNGGTNRSGDTMIYMALAEVPFKYSRSR